MERRDHRADRVVDAVGASAAGIGAAATAWLVAIETGGPPLVWASLAGVVGVFVGLRIMRAVPGATAATLIPFETAPIAFEDPSEVLLLEDEILLLDEPLVEPLVEPEPVSRVVQLFAPDAAATPGQMQARIERHLARNEDGEWDNAASQSDDASAALHAALSDIRRTLRRT